MKVRPIRCRYAGVGITGSGDTFTGAIGIDRTGSPGDGAGPTPAGDVSVDERATDRWENEGGTLVPRENKIMRDWPKIRDPRITLLPPFEHKEPKDDDTGLPESPIYSNYVKYLWKAHRRSGGVQIPADFGEIGARTTVKKGHKLR